MLGEAIALTKIEPSELSVEPIRADSVIFLESTEIILHIEFQKMFSTRSDSRVRVKIRSKRVGRQESPVFRDRGVNPVPANLEIT
ncbi:MAG: hypothetical protein ACKO7R_05015, partial [Pseudanabaena sp.]